MEGVVFNVPGVAAREHVVLSDFLNAEGLDGPAAACNC